MNLKDEKLIQLFTAGTALGEIAKELNMPIGSVKTKTYTFRKKGILGFHADILEKKFAEIPLFDGYLHIDSESLIAFGDPHIPLINVKMTNEMLALARAKKIKTCIIIGDFCDQHAFSMFPHSPDIPWKKEKRFARIFLRALLEVFDKIYILVGNHDVRALRLLKNEEGFSDFYQTITEGDDRVILSNYPYADVNKDWRVIHPGTYMRTAGSVAKMMSSKYLKNIISTHGHLTAMTYDISGRFTCVEIGGLLDGKKVEYVSKRVTTHPKWVNSYCWLYNDRPYIFDANSDYKFWLG